ncbi:MAG TPA: sigma-70 family RNA polymerase sigma factor [Acidimicrobiales bacterium]
MTDLMTAPGALEAHRRELGAHCRRMLGSASEADDAVQETFVRAWRSFHRFEGRSSLRTWLHRIATNVCLDMRDASQRRALPADPASWTTISDDDPADHAVARETVRLALGAALLHLPPRQRSVLILRDVLRWRATEVADLLGTTVASVNSALQRARSGLAAAHGSADHVHPAGGAQLSLLQRYVDAFERYDVDALVSLVQDR